MSATARLEAAALRCANLSDAQESTVLHRFIGKLQILDSQIESISFEEIADRLEAAVAAVETEAREVEV